MSNQRHRLMLPAELNSNVLSTDWIEIEETEPGTYAIVAENLTSEYAPALALKSWDAEAVDDDCGGSDLGWVNMSSWVKWQDVDCSCKTIYAPSVERIKEALTHIRYGSYCPDDI